MEKIYIKIDGMICTHCYQNEMFGFNIFNMIPTIDTNIQLGMLFLTGLFTSIHCISKYLALIMWYKT